MDFDLKKERLKKEMTQIELANAVGVSLAGYRLWESGGGNPSKDNLAKLKRVLAIKEK